MAISEAYNMDCMEYMKGIPDKYFDLAVVDPPYGIDITKSGRLKKYNSGTDWDKTVPDKSYFDELFRVSKEQIVWGGNYFDLPPTGCFLIWDKMQPEEVTFASCEFAWASLSSARKRKNVLSVASTHKGRKNTYNAKASCLIQMDLQAIRKRW